MRIELSAIEVNYILESLRFIICNMRLELERRNISSARRAEREEMLSKYILLRESILSQYHKQILGEKMRKLIK